MWAWFSATDLKFAKVQSPISRKTGVAESFFSIGQEQV
jgi:hypothetical protein